MNWIKTLFMQIYMIFIILIVIPVSAVSDEILVSSSTATSIEKSATLRICNTSPYSTTSVVYTPFISAELSSKSGYSRRGAEKGWAYTNGWYELEAGKCKTINMTFKGKEPEFYIYTQAKNNKKAQFVNYLINQIILNDSNPENDVNITKFESSRLNMFAKTQQCISNNVLDSVLSSTISWRFNCEHGESLAQFVPAIPLNQNKVEWFFSIQAPNLPLLETKAGVISPSSLNRALKSAQQLSKSIDIQMRFDENWKNSRLPFLWGANLADFNGPFNLGVSVHNVTNLSLFGEKRLLEDGDIVLGINGQPIFAERDMQQFLIEHGTSREHGIQVPLSLAVVKSGSSIPVQIVSRYFFNTEYYAYEDDVSALAIWYGAGDMVSFGQTHWASCVGSNILKGVGNVLTTGIVMLSDALYGDCDTALCYSGMVNVNSYDDVNECSWQNAQERALVRQKEEETYLDSQWLGMFTPGGVRVMFGKGMTKSVAKKIGKGALSTGLANGILEIIETGLWSIGTEPPGTPIIQRLSSASELAGVSFVAGFVLSASTKLMK